VDRPIRASKTARETFVSRPVLFKYAVGACAAIFGYLALASIDALEEWVELTREYEDYELDEVPLVFPFIFLWGLWIYWDLNRQKRMLLEERDLEIEQRKAAEENARAAEARTIEAMAHRELFFTAMSHDLRTPLNAIIGYSELLSMDRNMGERHQDMSARIAASADLLRMLVDGILDAATIDAGGDLGLRREVVDVPEELESILDFCRFIMDKPPIPMEIHGTDTDLRILIDRRRLRQCVCNLVFNAFRHGGRSPDVRVEIACPDQRHLSITVLDNGPGFSADHLGKVSAPVPRKHDPYVSNGSGVGFGLYMVSQYMALQDGALHLGNNANGGAEARLTFPLDSADAREESGDTPRTQARGCPAETA